MFKTQVINNLEQFKALRVEWNQLLESSYRNTIFLAWEWVYTWWEVFGRGEKLFIITVRNEKGKLIGIAPLYIKKTKYYKLPVREMAFIGMGLSDRQDFIISQGDTKVIDEIISKIREFRNTWDIVVLEQIPDDSPLASAKVAGNFRPEIENSSLCPYVRIEGSWEAYFKSLSKKFRRDMQHKTNRMSRFGKWEFGVEQNSENIGEVLTLMTNIEEKSRKQGTEKEFFLTKENSDFLSKVCQLCSENGWLDLSMISLNEAPIAYLLGFFYNNKYYAYNMAYVEDFHEASPGKLLLNEKIKWCHQQSTRPKEFDFLRGDSYIKSLWTSESRQQVRMVFFNGEVYSNIIRYAVFHVRPLMKKVLRKEK